MNQWDQVISEIPRAEFTQRVRDAADSEMMNAAPSPWHTFAQLLTAPIALTAIGFVVFNIWKQERTEDVQDVILMADLEEAAGDLTTDESFALMDEDLSMLDDLEVLEVWKMNS